MTDYLTGCLISFIVLNAVIFVLKEQLSRYKASVPITKLRAFINRMVICLVPVFRIIVIILLIVMAFRSDSLVENQNNLSGQISKQKKKMESDSIN